MSEERYSGFCSRLEFNSKNLPDSFEKDRNFTATVFDKPDQQFRLSFFTVHLKPVYGVLGVDGKEVNSRIPNDLRNSYKLKDLDPKISATDTTSCDSFYSCQSSTSLQELKSKERFEEKRKATAVPNRFESDKNKFDREEDTSNKLTMVNAIFFKNNIGDCVGERNLQNKQKTNYNCDCRKRNKEKASNTSFTNRLSSDGYICEDDYDRFRRGRPKRTNQKPLFKSHKKSFSRIVERDLLLPQEVKRSFNLPFSEPVTSGEIDSLENKHFSSKDEFEDHTDREKKIPTKFVFQKKKYTNSKPTTEKNIQVELPNVIFSKSFQNCDVSRAPSSLKPEIEENELVIKESHEVTSLIQNGAKNSCVLGVPSNEDCVLNDQSTLCGDGNIRDKEEITSTSISLTEMNESFKKRLDESVLRKLVSQSLSKIQNESRKDNSCKEVFYENNQKYSQTQLPFEQGDANCQIKTSHETNINISGKQRKVKRIPLDLECGFNSDANASDNSNNNTGCIIKEEIKRTSIFTQLIKENYTESDQQTVTETQRRCVKRNPSRRQTVLPVIEEESLESILSDSSEENQWDNFCLVDNLGRPIHLFDFQGLPLTDHRGRPLRTALGELLIKCDKTGIPILDYDEDESSIFDMFGRRPHEDSFDPTMAPEAVCNKLSTSNGEPLLLFDVEGQPLTSVSGMTLVDSSGRSLLSFTRNLDDAD